MKTGPRRPTPLFALARRVAPEAGRDWLEAMRLELPFVPARERWRWGVSALGLALRWRLLERPAAPLRAALVTATLLALVAALVAVPNLPLPNTTLPWRGPQAPPTLREAAAPAAAPVSAAPPPVEARQAPEPFTAQADAHSLGAAAASYDVPGGSLTLRAQREVEVVLAEADAAERRLRLAAGEQLEFLLSAPLRVRVQDAGALEALTETSAFKVGEDGQGLEVVFVPTP